MRYERLPVFLEDLEDVDESIVLNGLLLNDLEVSLNRLFSDELADHFDARVDKNGHQVDNLSLLEAKLLIVLPNIVSIEHWRMLKSFHHILVLKQLAIHVLLKVAK